METVTSAVGERPERALARWVTAVSDRLNRAIRSILLLRPIAAAASQLWTARASQEPTPMSQVPGASASGRSICLSRTTPPVKKLLLLPACASSYFQWKCNFLKTAMPLLTDVHHHCSNLPLCCARMALRSRPKPCARPHDSIPFLMTCTELRFSLTRSIHRLRSESKAVRYQNVLEPPGVVLKLHTGAVGSSRTRALRECLLALFWLIVGAVCGAVALDVC